MAENGLRNTEGKQDSELGVEKLSANEGVRRFSHDLWQDVKA
jgi:hypothetical protein